MNIEVFDIVYLFVNAISSYATYNIFQVFFESKRVKNQTEALAYILLFVMTSFVFLKYSIPALTVITNIIILFLISLCYIGTLQKRLISVLLVYVVLLCIEDIIFAITHNTLFSVYSKVEYNSVAGVMIIGISNLVVSTILKKFKNIKKGIKTPLVHWMTSMIVPIVSIYIGHILLEVEGLSQIKIVTGIISLLIINFAIILIYDSLSNLMEEKIQQAVIKEKIKSIEEQNQLREQNYEMLENFRHDQKNHISILKNLVKKENIKEAQKYMEKIGDIIYYNYGIDTGNIVLDNIISIKIGEANLLGIEVKVDSHIPMNIRLDPFLMSIIVGNLLDNSIEASVKLEQKTVIEIFLLIKNKKLIISIENEYLEEPIQGGAKFWTTKKDKKNHGIGLKSVNSAVENLKGTLTTIPKDNKFKAIVTLPI